MALARLAEEDPTFRVRTDQETGQTIIAGMGELHLEVITDRMRREFRVEAKSAPAGGLPRDDHPAGARREGRFMRQTGGRGQYGHVVVELRAERAGQGLRVRQQDRRRIDAARIHRRRSTRASARRWTPAGGAGYPVVDIRATLVDGSFHEVDSTEMAFKIAGSMALKEAVEKGRPVILEPIMKVEVTTPEEFLGDVIGDLNSRRGHVEGMESAASAQVVRGVRAAGRHVRLCHRPALVDPGRAAVTQWSSPTTSSCRNRWPKKWSRRRGNRQTVHAIMGPITAA